MADEKNIKLYIEAILKSDQFKSGVKTLTSELEKAKNSNKGFIDTIKDLKISFVAAIAATKMVYEALKSSINAYMESEKAANSLSAAFAKTYKNTEELTKKFSEFAKEQQKLTTFEDDAIIKNAAYMQSMLNLSEDGLENATKATMDFAAATGMDLETATKLITKSISGSTELLGRYGLQVENSSTKSGRLTNVMEALNAKFGGRAAAELNTYAGRMKQLQNQFGDLQEVLGEGVLRALDGFKEAMSTGGSGGMGGAISGIVDNAERIVLLFRKIGQIVGLLFNQMIDGWKMVLVDIPAVLFAPLIDAFKKLGNVIWTAMTNPKDIKKAVDEMTKFNPFEAWKNSGISFLKEYKEKGKQYGALIKKIATEGYADIPKAKSKATAQVNALEDQETKYLKQQYVIRSRLAQTFGDKVIEQIVTNGKSFQAMEEEIMRTEQERDQAEKDKDKDKFDRMDALAKKQKEEMQAAKDTAAEMAVLGGIGTIAINSIGDALDGTTPKIKTMGDMWKQTVTNVMNSKSWQELLAKGIVDTIDYIVNEFGKAQAAMAKTEENNMAIMTDVWKAGIDEQIRVLEGRQARDRALMDERHAWEMEEFENTSATAMALKDMKEREAAEAYAAMTAEEQAKFDIQKKYDDERKALEEKQAAEKKALEDAQKAARNEAKAKQFEANKKIQMAQIRIDWSKAESEIHKTFWAPWDEGQRNDQLGQLRDRYSGILNLIGGQSFIPEYARGTRNARSGIGLVGERGPELMNFGGGEQVISNSDLVGAMVQGLNLNRMGNNQTSNSYTTNSSNQSFAGANFNLHGVQDPRSLLLAIQKEANAMGSSVLR
jgi:hypothetical protein